MRIKVGIIGIGLAGLCSFFKTPFIMIGRVFAGLFTSTELAVIAVAYALLIDVIIHRALKIKDLTPIIKFDETAATIMFTVANAGLFAYILPYEKILQQTVEEMLNN